MTTASFMSIEITADGDEYLVVRDCGDEGVYLYGSMENATKGQHGIHVSLNVDALERALLDATQNHATRFIHVPDMDGDPYLRITDADEGVFLSIPDAKSIGLHVGLAVPQLISAIRRIIAFQDE